jgi:uncharacterized protein (DUF2147 family)
MKRKLLILLAVIFSLSLFQNEVNAQASKIVGTWKTIDDETGEAKSHVQIFESKGLYYGKVIKLLTEPQDKVCEDCTGSYKDKKIVGMVILLKMEEDGDGLDGGKILDPGNGKWYNCSMELDAGNADKLDVRGSLDKWGIAGRTQSWYRLK